MLGVALGNNFGTFGVGQLFGLQNSSGMIGSKHPKAKEIRGVDKPLIDFVRVLSAFLFFIASELWPG